MGIVSQLNNSLAALTAQGITIDAEIQLQNAQILAHLSNFTNVQIQLVSLIFLCLFRAHVYCLCIGQYPYHCYSCQSEYFRAYFHREQDHTRNHHLWFLSPCSIPTLSLWSHGLWRFTVPDVNDLAVTPPQPNRVTYSIAPLRVQGILDSFESAWMLLLACLGFCFVTFIFSSFSLSLSLSLFTHLLGGIFH